MRRKHATVRSALIFSRRRSCSEWGQPLNSTLVVQLLPRQTRHFFFVHFVRSAAEFTIPNQGDQNNLDIWEVVKYTTFFRNVPYGPAGTI